MLIPRNSRRGGAGEETVVMAGSVGGSAIAPPLQIPGQEVRKARGAGFPARRQWRRGSRRHHTGARPADHDAFASSAATNERGHFSRNSHHHLAHRVIHSMPTAARHPGEPSPPTVPANFTITVVDRKQPTRQAMNATRRDIFSNTLPTDLSTSLQQPLRGVRRNTARRRDQRSAESPEGTRRHAYSTVCQQLFHRNRADRERPRKCLEDVPFQRPLAREHWVSRLFSEVRGDRRGHARRGHARLRCPQSGDAPLWRLPHRPFPGFFAGQEKSCGPA